MLMKSRFTGRALLACVVICPPAILHGQDPCNKEVYSRATEQHSGEALGPDHPDTAESLNCLAGC